MTNRMEENGGRGINPWRATGWGLAALLLLLPALAMQAGADVSWTAGDFVFAALMLGTVGLMLELAVRASLSWAYRAGTGFAVASGFLIIWVNGAVGMIGSEDNPYNLLFLGIIPLALIGAVLARFRAAGMGKAMALAGLAQIGVAIGGMPADLRGGALSALLASLWLLSAAFYGNAAADEADPA